MPLADSFRDGVVAIGDFGDSMGHEAAKDGARIRPRDVCVSPIN